MMKRAYVTVVFLSLWAVTTAQSLPPATYASATELQTALEAQDRAPMMVARVENTDLTRVNLIHRTEPRNAILHATGWEVHHVTDGRATIVTGGQIVSVEDGRGPNVTTIVGGDSRRVGPGDVIVIPAGTPHWYSDIEDTVTYLEVRYDPGPG